MTRILEARLTAGLSQKEVAITLGVRAPSVCAWEKGTNKPSWENLQRLADLYQVPVDYLLGTDKPTQAIAKADSEEPVTIQAEITNNILRHVLALDDDEKDIIDLYRSLIKPYKRILMGEIEKLALQFENGKRSKNAM